MSGFIEGIERDQTTLFPERLEDWIDEDHLFPAVDLFVDELELAEQPSMLPGRDVKPVVKAAGPQMLRAGHYRIRQPSHQRFTRSLADLEADRFFGLALNN